MTPPEQEQVDGDEAETRQFQMHPQLLYDVIERQAGTLAKAILEGVMNAVDANASTCEIRLEKDTLVIEDNGDGFEDKEEIYKFFEVFGQPQEEWEKKTYGRFRMGRGQIFSYGRNVWQTNDWIMDVDIKKNGLDYNLKPNPDGQMIAGCKITVDLYDEIYSYDIRNTKQKLEKWVKYAPIDVIFNDELISDDVAAVDWDVETEDAYIKFSRTGGVSVYNKGVHVRTISGSRFGIGGTVVSKKRLKVNFARNDIQSDCEIWNKVKPILREKGDKVTDTEKLDSAGRQRVADRIMADQIGRKKAKKAKVITTVQGRHLQVKSFLSRSQYTVCEMYDDVGDALHSRTFAVVAEETLERFGIDNPAEFADELADKVGWWKDKPEFTNFEIVREETETYQNVLDTTDLSPKQRAWRDLCRHAKKYMPPTNLEEGIPDSREIQIGESPHDQAWTDQETYIALSKSFLEDQQFNLKGFVKVAMVILHEMGHVPDETSHGKSFYQRFHDMAVDTRGSKSSGVGRFVQSCLRRAPTVLAKHDLKVPSSLKNDYEAADGE